MRRDKVSPASGGWIPTLFACPQTEIGLRLVWRQLTASRSWPLNAPDMEPPGSLHVCRAAARDFHGRRTGLRVCGAVGSMSINFTLFWRGGAERELRSLNWDEGWRGGYFSNGKSHRGREKGWRHGGVYSSYPFHRYCTL